MKNPAIIHGDCIEIIPTLGPFAFIFADPPFNTKQKYSGYDDNREDYEQFTQQWIEVCWNACSGVLALHGCDDLIPSYLRAAERLNMHCIAWIIWHYRFGQCNRSNWINSHCHCLLFAMHLNYAWNPEAVLVPSDRASKYDDPRIHETERGGMRLPSTVWGIPSDGPYWGRVQGNSKERVASRPNQLPELYLRRLLLAYTNKGDRVLDPFGGTGTTAVVASSLKRKWITIDIDPDAIKAIRKRVKRGVVR